MPAAMRIRQAQPEEGELLVQLGRETFYDTFVGTCSDEDMDLFLRESFAPAKVDRELRQEGSYFYLVLGENEESLGYARLFADRAGAATLGPDYAQGAIELVRFYLKRKAFGSGAAQQLMQHCLGEAKRLGFVRIYLGVWEKNYRAQRFYEKCGFAKIGEKIFMVGTDAQTDWYYGRVIGDASLQPSSKETNSATTA